MNYGSIAVIYFVYATGFSSAMMAAVHSRVAV